MNCCIVVGVGSFCSRTLSAFSKWAWSGIRRSSLLAAIPSKGHAKVLRRRNFLDHIVHFANGTLVFPFLLFPVLQQAWLVVFVVTGMGMRHRVARSELFGTEDTTGNREHGMQSRIGAHGGGIAGTNGYVAGT